MENIHICLAADNNYAPHAGVLVASILKHLPSDKKLNVHVLDGGISEQNKLYFGQLRRIGDFDVRYYPMNNDEFKNCPLTYLTVATYYRLKIGSILKNLARVIYLDCDMVACGDLSELWHYDLQGKTIGAVEDPLALKNMRRLGIGEAHFYFNAGLLLIDLDKWRRENTQERLFDYLSAHPEQLKHQDQDLLNVVLFQQALSLPLRFNSQYFPRAYSPQRRQEYAVSLQAPLLIHYIMSDKPWRCDSTVFRRRFYIDAFKLTPWYSLHRGKYFFNMLGRVPAVLFKGLKYWYKHPVCFVKPKFWRKVKGILRPLSELSA